MNQENIGKYISKKRKEKKMTQQQLADKLNVTDRAIGNWENGRRLPDYSIIKDLCNELEITINEFFAGEDIKEDKKYKKKADENIEMIVEKINEENTKFEKNMTIIFITTTILTIIILLLLPLKSFKDICIFIMVIILAVISNTINIIAMALKNK